MENENKKVNAELNDKNLVEVAGGAIREYAQINIEAKINKCASEGCFRVATVGKYCEKCYQKIFNVRV